MKNGEAAPESTRKRIARGLLLRRPRTDVVLPFASLAAFTALSLLYRRQGEKAFNVSLAYCREMVSILPGVLVLMGLFTVWVKRETVVRLLGEGSGVPGILLAIFLGTLPTGPLYIAFPLACALLAKGARPAAVMAFLSAWACIKIPQELVEVQFLGLKFMLLRLALTVVLLVPSVIAAEHFYCSREKHAPTGAGPDTGGGA